MPRGIQGEIMIRGDNVMKGYYKAPDLTVKAIEALGESAFVIGEVKTGDKGVELC